MDNETNFEQASMEETSINFLGKKSDSGSGKSMMQIHKRLVPFIPLLYQDVQLMQKSMMIQIHFVAAYNSPLIMYYVCSAEWNEYFFEK